MKYLFLCVALSLMAVGAPAQDVSTVDVEKLASELTWYLFPGEDKTVETIEPVLSGSYNVLYIINLSQGGWMLVSGDKSAEPLLAFDREGKFELGEKNPYDPRSSWIEGYVNQVLDIKAKPAGKGNIGWEETSAIFKSTSKSDITINPFIEVLWNQSAGWNRFCPEDAAGPGGHAYAGCVAVAMAQALSVYHIPDSGTSLNSYYHETYGTITVNFEDWGYKWDSMSYTSSDNYNSLLLYHCAVAVDMDFGPDGSSAYTSKSKPALSTYFSVSKKTAYKARRLYESTWNDMLVEELLKGRPIIYAGDGGEGSVGHAFNIDGVVEGKYFHINWGWSGSQNGFFLLDGLTPGTSDYTQNQTALLGIQPYYYPTDILLSNSIVPEDVDPGASIGGIIVIDEAVDNEYTYSLATDSTLIEGEWIHDYYIDSDTLRTGRFFTAGEVIRDTVWIKVEDRFNNILEKEIYLTFETTSGSHDSYYNDLSRSFVIYPNPAGDYFSFFDNNSIPVSSIKLFNLSGQMERYIPASGPGDVISVQGLARGAYILEVVYADGLVIRKKLIKQ